MKISKYLIGLILIFSIFIVSCAKENANEVKYEGNKILVQNRVANDDNYAQLRKISDKTKVEKVKAILESISWEHAKVSMTHPPEYKFYFESNNEKSQSNKLIYELWISPNTDKVELVIDSESKYVQLDDPKSAEIFEILTGEELSDQKINSSK